MHSLASRARLRQGAELIFCRCRLSLFLSPVLHPLMILTFKSNQKSLSPSKLHTHLHTDPGTKDQQGQQGSVSEWINKLELCVRAGVCMHVHVRVCMRERESQLGEKEACDCLLGTDVCANHHQHFPSLPISAQVIGSPRWADDILPRHKRVCVYIAACRTVRWPRR